ncbi:MAG TPA: adenosylcobinamide-GDP ribazoletransferase, partial [Thermoanaerobacterales bacterium]|nr:adenosylcobinamide-GDP ribazoletransferase [Thermoanaerobacterales bacterium]
MGFIRALTFLTRFPIYPKFIDEHLLARSTVYFPIVGLLIGLILGYMDIILGYLFHDAVRAIILIIAYITITGGLHLDGLVDTFDGILGGYTKEEILEIMRDSSMGTFGGIALIVSLMLKFALYISFTNEIRFVALILAPSISRWILAYGKKVIEAT